MLRRGLDLLYLSAGYLAGVFLVAIFALMMLLSIGREINLNVPSGDDFAAWSLVAMAFLGLAHTFKKGEMIRVGLLLERLHGPARRIAELVSLTIAAAFIAFFTWQAGGLAYDSWRFFDMSTGVVSVPLWIPQMGMVLGLAILLIAIVEEWLIVARGGKPSYEPEPPQTTEELIERVAQGGGV
ncbi:MULTISPECIES: TRAP transporter small permease [unclassified Bosea (in: a-proteobacteria)]|uniref:TRAP transporter small permease n=1 Tax=unclassified Bosea (in: a-proteobacteria) TaxID=2653178 RepID=UPI0009542DEA|nr:MULTISPECIES: TRAP transporter small permease [unclassified Bosea (in: a-proteobacteria)]TAJ31336.1 MAG: TRAP transporter small permease [Bosea sp. (in: a-proteobacteria)]SIQ32354.1 TRAP-type C4-dicarboxylate transport system, small permease component [Bosea sp. TND4EK4]